MTEYYLVADFAGEPAEARAFCEAHPEFEVVDLKHPDMEFLCVGINLKKYWNDKEHVYNIFEIYGWDRGSVWNASFEMKDED